MAELKEFHQPDHTIQWCPGCGNFGILTAIKKALSSLDINPKDAVLVSGIGCSGKTPHYIKTYGIETIHGRTLPVATAVKFCNHSLKVIALGGDGDGYGIGIGHFMHAVRRNVDITYIVHDNGIYGLTKGQTSPTTRVGVKTTSTPNGSIEQPINGPLLAISGGATFVARAFAGDLPPLKDIFEAAISHRGFSLVNVLQPCVSFNKSMTYEWYKKNTEYLPDDWDKKSKWGAMEAAADLDLMKLGVLYQVEQDIYEDSLPQLKEEVLCRQNIFDVNIGQALDKYM